MIMDSDIEKQREALIHEPISEKEPYYIFD